MKQIVTFILFLISSQALFGQTGKIRGSVFDAFSNSPLELATVIVLKQDSSLVTYQLSDKSGLFFFEKLPLEQRLLISVSYTGYQQYFTTVQLMKDRTDTLPVLLSLINDTNAVVVTSKIPVRMNGDTLEINPGAFSMKEDAVVEELLNQVTGIVIWSDGSITVNGRKVQSLLVDGKPFMGSSDARIATQNLPKSAIDKIQLYLQYDRNNIGQEQKRQDSLLTMNIKLKEESKQGYFGKVGIGIGTMERFESDLSFQMYNKQTSIGIAGGINNINKSIGSTQEIFQNNTYRNSNPNLYNVGRFGSDGINKNYSLGSVFSHSFIKEGNSRQNNRIDVNYNTTGTRTDLTDLNLQSRSAVENPLFIRDEGVLNSRQDGHNIGVNYVKTNSYNDNLNLNGTLGTNNEKDNSIQFTEVRDSANQLQSTNRNNTIAERRSDDETILANYATQNTDKPLKSFTIQINAMRRKLLSYRESATVFKSVTDQNEDTSITRNYSEHHNTYSIGANLNYLGFKRLLMRRHNLFGFDLQFSQSLNYTRTTNNTVVNDFDQPLNEYKPNSSLSNRNKSEVFEYTPSISILKRFSKVIQSYYRTITFQTNLIEEIKNDRNVSTLVKRNLNRNFEFFQYEGSFDYQYQKFQKYSYGIALAYRKSFEYPSIDQLYAIVDDINSYEIRVGNALLRNQVDHSLNFTINFNTQNPESPYSINGEINSRLAHSINPFTDSVVNDFSGKRTYYDVNGKNGNNLYLYLNLDISRRFGKSKLLFMYLGQFNGVELPNYIDGRNNISKTGNLSNQFSFQFSLRSAFVFNLEQTFQNYKLNQTAPGLNSFRNSTQTTKLGVVLNYPLNFSFGSTLDRIDNSRLDKPVILWNSFVTYRFLQQQGELKFSAMDILKQFRNIDNSVDAYGTSTRVTNGLQQYFLLTFAYYPRRFGKAEINKEEF